jgi:hypothetical protein
LKLTIAGIVLTVLVLVVTFYDVRRGEPREFAGEIMDSRCAALGSHAAIMKEQNFLTPTQCALFCAHYRTPQSAFVLFDAASKRIYQLSDQNTIEPYVSENVKISGDYDAATKTIHVETVTAVP